MNLKISNYKKKNFNTQIWDDTQKLKLLQNQKLIVTKLKNSNCDKT